MPRAQPIEVPAIYTPAVQRQCVGIKGRIIALVLALTAMAVLVIAVTLPPSGSGVGTHRALGFRACEFLERTRLPCATCGMTTSFSHFVRGQWHRSLYVQPMGFLLALGCGGMVWAGFYIALTGSPLHRLLHQVPALYTVPAIMGFGIAAWGWKIFIHLNQG